MQAFLLKNIIPKLEQALQKLDVSPRNQNLDPWNWFVDWRDFLTPAVMAAMLNKLFFPKWSHALTAWLSHGANFGEVGAWFQGWKREFERVPGLLDHAEVKDSVGKAMDMISRAAAGDLPVAPPPPGSREKSGRDSVEKSLMNISLPSRLVFLRSTPAADHSSQCPPASPSSSASHLFTRSAQPTRLSVGVRRATDGGAADLQGSRDQAVR